MKKIGTPIRVVKAGEEGDLPAEKKTASATQKPASNEKVEPSAQMVEVEPGVYDITVTCSCGGRTVVRCHSLSTPQSAPPQQPQKKEAKETPPPKTPENPKPEAE